MKNTQHIHLYIVERPALPPETGREERRGTGDFVSLLLEGAACVAMIVLCVSFWVELML